MLDAIGLGAMNLDEFCLVDSPFLKRFDLKPGDEVVAELEQYRPLLKSLPLLTSRKSGGGSAANTIFALSEMGFNTGYIGRVGTDKDGEFLISELGNTDTTRIKREGDSGKCVVLLNEKRERTDLIFPNTNDMLSDKDLNLDYLRKTEYLLLTSFMCWKSDSPLYAQIHAAEEAVANGVKVSFDPGAPYAKRGMQKIEPILRKSFIVFPNKNEVEILTGEDYKKGAKKLIKSPATEIVTIKLEERGCYILTKDKEHEIPSEVVKPVDKTGAGDVYNAGFLAGLIWKKPIHSCGEFANHVAKESILEYGRGRYPDRKTLEIFFGGE